MLGLLDDYVTRSGYLITPVVVWAAWPLPAAARRRRGGARSTPSRWPTSTCPAAGEDPAVPRPVIQLPLLGRLLDAPTAAIIYQFCQVALHGMATRVAHFEQPVFAWK